MSSKENGVELKSASGSALLKKVQSAFSEQPAEPSLERLFAFRLSHRPASAARRPQACPSRAAPGAV